MAICVEQHKQDIDQAAETLKEAQVSASKLRKELGKLGHELQASEVTLAPSSPTPFQALTLYSGLAYQSGEETAGRARNADPVR